MSNEQLAEWILEQTSDALIYADTEGNIRRWNAASCQVFGFSAEDALGQSLDLIIPKHLREAHWRGFDAAMQSRQLKLSGKPTLTRALHKEGHKLYVEMTFALVKDPHGVVQGSVSMARDVTARVEAEKAARQAGG
ncbi:PAS domain-containing protein [Thiopseudomonas denitrificans]|uniref:PAS domain S-box-containing protein n=1 Tax=Thiopseudomonas denitrificans TaxID=1501432 RepID=A0A4R6U3M6_9GAMM|nr:PAS domain S-box protein [Thiopseudomonas denitrificans]TDQ40022.1 PAS domain S-box-containing protein [Thiopseudomonas denitrificans]